MQNRVTRGRPANLPTFPNQFMAIFVYPLSIWGGVLLGGAWTGLSLVLGATLYPLLELLPLDNGKGATGQASPRHFRVLLYAYLLVHLLTLGAVCRLVGVQPLPWWQSLLLALSLGTMTGSVGFAAAHELIHSRVRHERILGQVLLAMNGYLHFRIAHVSGHHVHVGTLYDPATARLGESIYAFMPRAIVGGWLSAWQIESARLQQQRQMLWCHGMIRDLGWQMLVVMAAWGLGGGPGVGLWFVQAACAIALLTSVDYIQHYGLQRLVLSDGRLEPVSPRLAWNTDAWLTNRILFNLGRHSDHHTLPHRPYQELVSAQDLPQLPFGYFAMILFAAIPPLWRQIMDHRAILVQATARSRLLTDAARNRRV